MFIAQHVYRQRKNKSQVKFVLKPNT